MSFYFQNLMTLNYEVSFPLATKSVIINIMIAM